MPTLYARKIVTKIAGFEIAEPRMTVELDREIDRSQDRGRIDIYNLSPEHAQRIWQRGGPILIQAGYPETLAILFDGQVQRVVRQRRDLAHVTRVHLGDSIRAANRLSGTFSRSYAGAVSIRQIAGDIIRDGLGLAVGPLDCIPPHETFPNFYWAGDPAAALDALLRRTGCTWYEEDGTVRINRAGHVQADAPRLSVSPQTGLVGTPADTDEGAECTMFLDARARLGGVVDLRSDALSGTYKIVGMRHRADNWTGAFTTTLDMRELETNIGAA